VVVKYLPIIGINIRIDIMDNEELSPCCAETAVREQHDRRRAKYEG
jgi:hypothetical protein